MSSVPPPKPRRRLSFHTKRLSRKDASLESQSPTNKGVNMSSRGLFRKSTSGKASSSTDAPQDNTFSKIQALARDPVSRFKDNLKTVVEEKSLELGNMAKETSLALGKRSKEVVERLKKRNNAQNEHLTNVNIFGLPLKTATKLTRIEKDKRFIHKDPSKYWLPAIMVRCLEFLDTYGVREVGIYRVCASQVAVERIRGVFNSGADLNFLQSTHEDPHAVAALLRRYLRELPEPILTTTLAGEFNACVQHYANSAYATSNFIAPSSTLLFTSPVVVPDGLPHALASIVSRLPPYHFYLLRALSSHLARVNNNSEINKMNISNLGLIFCPSLSIGSILLKAFVEHLDIVFGGQCQLEEQELLEEEQENPVKEKQVTDIYRTTNISEEFSKSIKDLLTFEEKAVKSSGHSLPSSFSSSYSSTNVNEDGIYSNTTQMTANTKDAVKYGTISTVRTRESLRAISSSPSLYSMQMKEANNSQPINGTNASNSFGGNKVLFSLSDVTNDNQNHNVSTAALMPEPSDHNNSAVSSFYRRRTRSAGVRNVPLNLWDYSSSSATSSDDEGNAGDKSEEVEDASPKLMAFNYFDQSGVETLGVLNLSPRASHQWALHNNGVDGKKSATTSVLNRRPSLEEREYWKRTILTASSEEIAHKNLDGKSDETGSKAEEHGSHGPKDAIEVAPGLNGELNVMKGKSLKSVSNILGMG
ncbi:2614_t:CDS:2 [Paraglomus brasilianum]|uniref:2614_t:CDS:1 n=1 Tax=Paraglomus brasilianum TaxID=144538 RepID=A0A9N9D379_9GLOM|nr:2614_t:CDS:2 [Paraglomus brasilianum]